MAARLLLVDDDPVAVRELGKALQRALPTIALDCFTNSRDALLSLRAHPYAVVLTDYHMPGLNGLALLQAARESGSEAIFILVTGEANPVMVADGLRLGLFYIVPKPVPMLTVLTMVHQALAVYELRQEVGQLRQILAETGASLGEVVHGMIRPEDESQGQLPYAD